MGAYFLIESRDPFEHRAVEEQLKLAKDLKEEGHDVTFFLVQNGVFPARKSIHTKSLTQLKKAGVRVLADEFSLRERGIKPDSLAKGIMAAPLEEVIDAMANGHKVIWH